MLLLIALFLWTNAILPSTPPLLISEEQNELDMKNSTEYTVIIAADPQAWRLETGDPNSISNREAWIRYNEQVYKSISGHKADFMIINGDLTEYGRTITYTDYANVYKIGKKMPVFEGLGNHDYVNNINDCAWNPTETHNSNLNNQMARSFASILDLIDGIPTLLDSLVYSNQCTLSAIMRMYVNLFVYAKNKWISNFDVDRNSLAYSWDYGRVHYVQLQNYPTFEADIQLSSVITEKLENLFFGVTNENTIVIRNSLDWLEDDLKKAKERGKVIILNFHDGKLPYSSNDREASFINKTPKKQLDRFRDIITKFQVKAIFVGHSHQRSFYQKLNDEVFGSVPVFTSGALFRGEYFLLSVRKSKISVTAYQFHDGKTSLVEEYDYIEKNSG